MPQLPTTAREKMPGVKQVTTLQRPGTGATLGMICWTKAAGLQPAEEVLR